MKKQNSCPKAVYYQINKKVIPMVDGMDKSSFLHLQHRVEFALDYKLVIQDKNNQWSPPWMVQENECFLVKVMEESILEKGKRKKTGKFYLYCCGMDDTFASKQNLSLDEAIYLYGQIQNGTSKEDLNLLGFILG